MFNKGSLSVVVTLFLLACSVDDKSHITNEIKSNNARLCRYYLLGYCDSIAQLYTSHAWVKYASEPPLMGKEAIKENWEYRCSLGIWYYKLNTIDLTVTMPMVIERGTYYIQYLPGPNAPSDMKPFIEAGNYLSQWQLEKGKWLIENTVTSKDLTMK